MSGTAALSAARRRRASTVATPGQTTNGGTPVSYSNTPNPYYNSGQQQQQQQQQQGRGMPGGVSLIPQNMTIHENIQLIKTQMDQRLQLINTKGRSMPPEKLKMLQKQQEIQMQILKQKIAIAHEMDDEDDNQAPHFPPQQMQQQQPQQQPQSKVEPPIIFDRGIPRPNPKYVAPIPNDVAAALAAPPAKPVNIQQQTPMQTPTQTQKPQAAAQAHKQPQSNRTVMPTATLSPFVSMTSAGGAIPPPIVILKSHDDKIGEHDAVLNDLTNRVNYIHSRIEQVERNGSLQMQEQLKQPKETVKFEQNPYANGEDENDNETDEGDEPMILMTEVISDLLDSREFMQGVVDKIMNETNLSEVIFKIDPIIKENQELRALIHSQQETLNQMNIMILKFLNTQAQLMLSNDSNSNSNPDVSVIDENQAVTTDCNEDGLYEDWQNSVESRAQEQQAQFDEEHHNDQDEQQDEQQPEEAQLEEVQQDEEQLEEVQLEEERPEEERPEEAQLEEEQLEEQLTTEVVESIENEVDATSDNEAPSFPDMDRLKLLVSEIPASDM
jgi:hypothetical protein